LLPSSFAIVSQRADNIGKAERERRWSWKIDRRIIVAGQEEVVARRRGGRLSTVLGLHRRLSADISWASAGHVSRETSGNPRTVRSRSVTPKRIVVLPHCVSGVCPDDGQKPQNALGSGVLA